MKILFQEWNSNSALGSEPSSKSARFIADKLVYALASVVIIVVAAAYWPVIHADFVWDDWPSFHDEPWLTQGDLWKHYIFRNFNSWIYYFRPLVVAFFAIQVRAFHSTPGPMHAVSLAIHLIDTALVGALSWQCAKLAKTPFKTRAWMTALCMALYGLHGAMIETVAWIGCQFDLITTMLMLAGLIANMVIRHRAIRAASLALIFFLAACAKESAISFPLLLVVFDWLIVNQGDREGLFKALGALIRRNWIAYVAILIAGSIYLIFRHWALGTITQGLEADPLSLFSRLQEICFIYLRYWKIILWPIAGMNPIHPIDTASVTTLTLPALITTTAGVIVFLAGFYAAVKHASPLGCMVMAATVSLLPVLRIIPGHFERSLYHERYATTALAALCAMLPLLYKSIPTLRQSLARTVAASVLAGLVFLWLAFSIINIRIILPMWSNDVNLWRWAFSSYPHASQAKDNLLYAYVKTRDYDAARAFSDEVLEDPAPCLNCMFKIAELAMLNNDIPRATKALERARQSPLLVTDKAVLHTYYRYIGELLIMEHKLDVAEQIIRTSISLDPKDPKSQDLLRKVLALKDVPNQTR